MSEPREVTPTPAEQRPVDDRPVHTSELPDTPTRDRSIPASAWIEAPPALTSLPDARYLRRIGPWLLWRSGPARGDFASYWVCQAADPADASHHFTFELVPDGTGSGRGPTASHTRFRTWKEDLRDHG